MTPEPIPREPLAVLIVEDSESDAQLIVRHLAQCGFDLVDERVDSAGAMRAALAARPWDVVISDFSLPGFGAGEALTCLKAADPDVPFIVVSGVIIDEEALALMRAGASDYVRKGNLARLAPAIRREVAEARDRRERRTAQAALVTTRQRHVAAIESAMDGYAALDSAGRVLEVNDAMCSLTGRARKGLLGLGIRAILLVDTAPAGEDLLAWAASLGQARFEGRLQRTDSTIHVAVSISHRPLEEAEFFVFLHDISERRNREEALRALNQENRRGREALLSVLEDQRDAQASLRESEERFRGMLEHNVSAVFVIEDSRFAYVNPRLGEILGCSPADLVGKPFLDFIVEADRPPIIEAVGRLMSGATARTERNFTAIRKDGTFADIGANATRALLRGRPVILGTAQDIGERKRAQEEIARYVVQLEGTVQSTLRAVSNMVELRDPYTAGHERRVGELAAAIGTELGLDAHAVTGLRLTGYVHDIGKISLPAETLSKPAKLSATEYELVKTHSQAGHDVLKDIDFPWPIAEVILQHHERLDGSGYPRALEGDEILPAARIIAIADVVEAMSSHRPYRAAVGIDAALHEIERGAGTIYDAGAASACLRLFREKGYAIPA